MPTFSSKQALISILSSIVFTFLDLLDILLCYLYSFLDGVLEDNINAIPCYCKNRGTLELNDEEEDGISETLWRRENIFRDLVCMKLLRWFKGCEGRQEIKANALIRCPRWSDCSCNYCVCWQDKQEEKLHLVVREPSQAFTGGNESHSNISFENVIFIHGFLSSSSIWTETVFPNISEITKNKFRLFAMDLLGFGRSPKPMNSKYRLKDHLEKIESSVIEPFHLDSYHIVAHSMGCIIALALAAKHPESVKSITLIAPPYFLSNKDEASRNALNKLAPKRVWPPLLFGSSVMSWYEHVGRTVCFLFCKNHSIFEAIMNMFTKRRDREFLFRDLTKHTHHSAWHTMHNVICGGANMIDKYLEVIKKHGIYVKIIQGDEDEVVPLECSYNLKSRLENAKLEIIGGTNHSSVLIGREKQFTKELEETWLICR